MIEKITSAGISLCVIAIGGALMLVSYSKSYGSPPKKLEPPSTVLYRRTCGSEGAIIYRSYRVDATALGWLVEMVPPCGVAGGN